MDDTDDGFLSDDSEIDDPDADALTARDIFFIGSIVGNAYEEKQKEPRRQNILNNVFKS
jgi:hypothetical protein